MNEYETVYIMKPDLPVLRMEKINERIQKIVAEKKGEVLTVKDWGQRKMAYSLGSHAFGHYVLIDYIGEGHFVSEIERILKYEEGVIRFLTMKVGSAKEAKSKDPSLKNSNLEEAKVGSFDLPYSYDDRYE